MDQVEGLTWAEILCQKGQGALRKSKKSKVRDMSHGDIQFLPC